MLYTYIDLVGKLFHENALHHIHVNRSSIIGQSLGNPSNIINRNEQVPRNLQDLSAKEGEIVLVEYIEQYPPFVMNPGMASEIVTYYRMNKDEENKIEIQAMHENHVVLPFDTSNTATSNQHPLIIGDVPPGKTVTTLNTNMFVMPIFLHKPATTDFLLIRTSTMSGSIPKSDGARGSFWLIREMPSIYVTGQMQPKIDFPSPKGKWVNVYTKHRIQSYLYRLIRKVYSMYVCICMYVSVCLSVC